jgi:hypothetical protein
VIKPRFRLNGADGVQEPRLFRAARAIAGTSVQNVLVVEDVRPCASVPGCCVERLPTGHLGKIAVTLVLFSPGA